MISKLLCIDDDEITQTLIRIVVERAAFAKEVITCGNGAEALAYYQQLLEEKSADIPELIFLDLNMPVMNGWEFLKEFTRHYYDQFSNTKIVVLSSSIDNMPSLPQYPYIDYITKPITNDILKRLSNELVRNEGVGVC